MCVKCCIIVLMFKLNTQWNWKIRGIWIIKSLIVAYKLELPTYSWVQLVFHVSCLNNVIDDKLLVQIILPEIDDEGKIILEPEVVTKTTTWQLWNQSISKHLIKWKNLPTKYSTWEDENFIQKHPELLKRWGKHSFKGHGHVSSL